MFILILLLLPAVEPTTLHLINNPAPARGSDCQSVGKWIKMKNRPLISYGASNRAGGNTGCFYSKDAILPPAQWAWIPPCAFRSLGPCRDPEIDDCKLEVERVCEILNGRDLLLVGDSTQFTLHNIILASLLRKQPDFHEHMEACPSYVIPCRNPFRVRYVRNDYLVWRQKDLDHLVAKHGAFSVRPWIQFVTGSTVLYMNRGSHVYPTAEVMASLNDTFHEIKRLGARLVYRNTAIPMAMSLQTSAPRNTTPPLVIENPGWGWDLIQEQNRLVEDMIAKEFPWITFNDIAFLSGFRTDSHVDPIHFCHPGAADWYWPMFFDSLLQ